MTYNAASKDLAWIERYANVPRQKDGEALYDMLKIAQQPEATQDCYTFTMRILPEHHMQIIRMAKEVLKRSPDLLR